MNNVQCTMNFKRLLIYCITTHQCAFILQKLLTHLYLLTRYLVDLLSY